MHFGSQNIISTDIARFPALIKAFGNLEPKATSFDPFLAKFTFADFPHFLGRFPPFLECVNTDQLKSFRSLQINIGFFFVESSTAFVYFDSCINHAITVLLMS